MEFSSLRQPSIAPPYMALWSDPVLPLSLSDIRSRSEASVALSSPRPMWNATEASTAVRFPEDDDGDDDDDDPAECAL